MSSLVVESSLNYCETNIVSRVSFRLWRKSLPGSCRNRKCSSRWAASRSALTPPPRAASPSSTPSPASTPPVSRRNLHTHRPHTVQMDCKDLASAAFLFCSDSRHRMEKSFLSLDSTWLTCSFCLLSTVVNMKEIFRFSFSVVVSEPLKFPVWPFYDWIIFIMNPVPVEFDVFWLLNSNNFRWLFAAWTFSGLDICTKERIILLPLKHYTVNWIR